MPSKLRPVSQWLIRRPDPEKIVARCLTIPIDSI
jgi:hypothetical protein